MLNLLFEQRNQNDHFQNQNQNVFSCDQNDHRKKQSDHFIAYHRKIFRVIIYHLIKEKPLKMITII